MTPWLLLGLAILLVIACGLFVAAEFAFVTVDRGQVDRAAADGDASAIGLQKALRTLSTQLSGAQVGITITNLAIGFLAEPAIAELLRGPLEDAGVADGAVGPVAVATGLVLEHPAHHADRRAGPQERRDLAALRDRAADPGADARLHRRREGADQGPQRQRRTRSSAGSASSRRRSSAPRAA